MEGAKPAAPSAKRKPSAAVPPVYPRYDVRPPGQAGTWVEDRTTKDLPANDPAPASDIDGIGVVDPTAPVKVSAPASEVAPFQFSIGTASGGKVHHSVRTVTLDSDPWFVLADVCRVQEIGNPSDAARRLDDDDKSGVNLADPNGRVQTTTVISEPGFYLLILRSEKNQARPFRRWVTAEVLPAIRKTGSYIAASVDESQAESIEFARCPTSP